MANSDHVTAEIDAPLPIFKRPKHDEEDDVKSNLTPSHSHESEPEPTATTDNGSKEVNSLSLFSPWTDAKFVRSLFLYIAVPHIRRESESRHFKCH